VTRRSDWIVAIRLRQLGDVLAALDSVRSLREYDAARRVAYVVDAPFDTLLGGLPFIDRVLTAPRGRGAAAWMRFLAEVRALQPEAAIDFHGSARSALIAFASGAPLRAGYDVRGRGRAYTIREPRGEFRDGVRVPHTPLVWGHRLARHAGAVTARDRPPEIPVPEAARARGARLLVSAGVTAGEVERRALVGLNPGRPVASKSWPVARFVALAERILSAGGRPLVLWGPGEEPVARAITGAVAGSVLMSRVALGDMPGVLVHLAALVSIDSGLKHLAVCVRVPTVTVFGSTDPREWHMGGPRDVFRWRGLSCSPCRRLTCPFGAPCMDIHEEDVAALLRVVTGAVA